jgi:SHS family lactate transporter-like MFS transporter
LVEIAFVAHVSFGLQVSYWKMYAYYAHTSVAFIPLWIIPTSFSTLAAGAFCVQFGVQGAWGVVRLGLYRAECRAYPFFNVQIPIQLAEMSPPAFRATFPGVAYQIGNVSDPL